MHRARSHAEGTLAASQEAPPDILRHPLVPQGEPELVADAAALADALAHARAAGSFAYDTEFIGELSYHPKLCLVQLATASRVFVVDPLAGLDLMPLWELIVDPSVEKIVIAGAQDLEPAFRHAGRPPANIMDVQVAAGFCGLPYPLSLARLVEEVVGVSLGKHLTFTHWDQRPMSPDHLRYAADDVRYLPAARAMLAEALEELGHAAWAAQECRVLCEGALYRFDSDVQYLRVQGHGSLRPRQLAVLRELTAWRDQAARQQDLPPRALVKDDVLVALARLAPPAVKDLNEVRGLPRPVEEAYGAEIVAAVARGQAAKPGELPPAPDARESPRDKLRIDSLVHALSAYGFGRRIDPALVATRAEVAACYRAARSGGPPNATHRVGNPSPLPAGLRLAQGWRKEFLGSLLGDFLGGRTQIRLAWSDGRLQAES